MLALACRMTTATRARCEKTSGPSRQALPKGQAPIAPWPQSV
jgi:hypothetical protein